MPQKKHIVSLVYLLVSVPYEYRYALDAVGGGSGNTEGNEIGYGSGNADGNADCNGNGNRDGSGNDNSNVNGDRDGNGDGNGNDAGNVSGDGCGNGNGGGTDGNGNGNCIGSDNGNGNGVTVGVTVTDACCGRVVSNVFWGSTLGERYTSPPPQKNVPMRAVDPNRSKDRERAPERTSPDSTADWSQKTAS